MFTDPGHVIRFYPHNQRKSASHPSWQFDGRRHTKCACSLSAFSTVSANSFWQTWALSLFPGFCESAMLAVSAVSAKSFWPTRALLKTAGFGETTEITEITVSTFGVVSDLGGLPASGPGEIREWRAGATTPLEGVSPWIGWVEFSKN